MLAISATLTNGTNDRLHVMKRIITCSDGTWNKPMQTAEGVIASTNVYKIKKLISYKSSDGVVQIPFYDPGVGTNWYDRLSGGAFGMGINKNIVDAYLHIVYHYEPGDEIYLFGFSRGAYTARSVAGLIRNCGLLMRENDDQINAAFDLYRRRDNASHPSAAEAVYFRQKYSHLEVRIKFIGVWDTVGALGVPLEWLDKFNKCILDCQFHDVELSSYVDYAYHAVSIDDHRKPFFPSLWEQKKETKEAGQTMEQMWFAGVHCDVGGGYNHHGLSDCALLWMIEKAKGVGLEFNDCGSVHPNPLDKMHNSMNFLYMICGSKDRKISEEIQHNEIISITVNERWDADTDNYQKKANSYLLKIFSNRKKSTLSKVIRRFFYSL